MWMMTDSLGLLVCSAMWILQWSVVIVVDRTMLSRYLLSLLLWSGQWSVVIVVVIFVFVVIAKSFQTESLQALHI